MKLLKLITRNPKTSIMGLASAVISLLTYYKVLTAESTMLWLAIIGAILGLFSKDGDVTGTGLNEMSKNNATAGPGGSQNPPIEGLPKKP